MGVLPNRGALDRRGTGLATGTTATAHHPKEKPMNAMARFVREEEGQTATEYMLLISVIVIAIVAAAYVFIQPFQDGVQALANDIKQILDTGKIGTVGTDR